MGRLHSNGKGISKSALPYSRAPPAWLKVTPDQLVDQICKLARKGATPSQIGTVLRDSHGVAQVKVVTGTFWQASSPMALFDGFRRYGERFGFGDDGTPGKAFERATELYETEQELTET